MLVKDIVLKALMLQQRHISHTLGQTTQWPIAYMEGRLESCKHTHARMHAHTEYPEHPGTGSGSGEPGDSVVCACVCMYVCVPEPWGRKSVEVETGKYLGADLGSLEYHIHAFKAS